MNLNDKYQAVIGLEVHAQLLTKSKLFCGDSAAYNTEPNIHISPFTLAHPGTLPVMNASVIEYAVKLGLALECHIEQHNYFARKNYFYPDLPKGYQVSQHTTPICKHGAVKITVAGYERNIRLNRIHIEEDAGKSLHDVDENYTAIDLNRAGVPLLEIVSEPDMHSSEEAFAYVSELRKLVTWLEICDGNMEEGSMRCDANISIRLKGETMLGTRVEIKNLNSIRNVKRAIDVEIERLMSLAEKGEAIIQETRSYDADKNITFSLRSKEDADDYRYFPEPDLTPFMISDEQLANIRNKLPQLPNALKKKFVSELGLSDYDAAVLCDDKEQAAYFEEVIRHTGNYKAAANWLLGPVKNYLNEHAINYAGFNLPAGKLADLIALVEEGKLNFGVASGRVFAALLEHQDQDPLAIATSLNLVQETNSNAVEQWVDEVIRSMPDKVKEFRGGKKGLIGLFAGQVKKLSKNKADMQLVNSLLEKKLNDQ
ncbi:MAG TPA: Asp-tRNA(Asn)/Glu-tRNA(Gln) amidotransferase subunit GatB [Ferruginibacter sp.]|nr:Asp-tRNA(Asn)/Glu-tRNA(Gln) amidotransferase subunit GatB [Ferruginibacter sp.]